MFGCAPADLPSWVLELIRDCLLDGWRAAHEAQTIPPRPQRQRRPGEYSFDGGGAGDEEVTQVGRRRK